jgi:hypothetical protein
MPFRSPLLVTHAAMHPRDRRTSRPVSVQEPRQPVAPASIGARPAPLWPLSKKAAITADMVWCL